MRGARRGGASGRAGAGATRRACAGGGSGLCRAMQGDRPVELFYWPGLPGRGEFVRLLLEDAGAPYVDVARLPEAEGGGVPAILRLLRGEHDGLLPLAPPILRVDGLVLAQVANICQFLAPRLGLAPADEAGRLAAHQLQLTIADLVSEVHDTHHPIAVSQYYEEQKEAARARAAVFVAQRLPRFLGYFERVLTRNREGEGLVGAEPCYVDLSLFHALEGLAYAFPNAFAAAAAATPGLLALRERIRQRPRLAAYLASPRRLAFNEHGIFRRYPELDLTPT